MRLPLRERTGLQADAFRVEASSSMRYVLLLNGVVANPPGRPERIQDIVGVTPTQHGPQWLVDSLMNLAPDALPGTDGPLIVALIL